MKLFSYIVLVFIFSMGVVFAQSTKDMNGKTHPVTITTPDTAIRAEVLAQVQSGEADKKLTYYWYSNPTNKILHTTGGYDGKLLHGTFSSFYGNNNLMEKGRFAKGLKKGEWVKWYSSGKINEVSCWRDGRKNGKYKLYNEQGELILTANFRNDQMHGTTTSYQGGKVLSTQKYKHGQLLPEKLETPKRKLSFKSFFEKKDRGPVEKRSKKEKQPKPEKKKKESTTSRS